MSIVDGVNIDNWHFDELSEAIREFKCIQNGEAYEAKPISTQKRVPKKEDEDYDETQIEEIQIPEKETKSHLEAKTLEKEENLSPWYQMRINIKVVEYSIVKPGWLSSDYAMFHCETTQKDGERVKV